MSTRFTYRSWILLTVAPALVAITGAWAWQVYRSAHRIILDGFDHKLLAVAQGTAASIDGDAHAAYQRRRTLLAFAPMSASQFAALDPATDEIVAVDAATGGARRIGPVPESGVRTFAALDGRLLALASDGASLVSLGPDARVSATVPLSQRMDGIFADESGLLAWYLGQLHRIDPVNGNVTPTSAPLPESVLSVAVDPKSHRRYGLCTDRSALVELGVGTEAPRRIVLHPPAGDGGEGVAPLPFAIAYLGDQMFGIGDGLTRIDPRTGVIDRGDFKIGFFDVGDPFYRSYRGAFVDLQKRADLTYLYTQVYLGDRQIYYILDGTVGAGYSLPGSTDVMPESSVEGAELSQLVGRPWVSPIQRWQAWGLLKSCFTPVRDFSGKVVAMAGADVDIGIIRRRTRWALFGAITVGVCSLLAAASISLRVAAALTRPLRQLKESALWIAAGDYHRPIAVPGGRELARLASTLERLRVRLEEQEKRSRAWQDELQVQRERTALVRALEDTAVRLGGAAETRGALGACRAAGTTVWWFGQPDPDPVATACQRARLVVLTQQLLASGHEGGELLTRLVDAFPALDGAACWQAWTETLLHHTRQPVCVRLGDITRDLFGSGQLACDSIDELRWEGVTRPVQPVGPRNGGQS